jgi:hypothetical protein
MGGAEGRAVERSVRWDYVVMANIFIYKILLSLLSLFFSTDLLFFYYFLKEQGKCLLNILKNFNVVGKIYA